MKNIKYTHIWENMICIYIYILMFIFTLYVYTHDMYLYIYIYRYVHMICIYIYTWYIYIYIYAHDICIYIYRYTHFKIPNRLGIKGTPGHSTRVFQPIPGTKTWRRTVAATWKRSRFAPPLPSSPTTSYRRTSCRGWNIRASWRWKIYEKMGNMQKKYGFEPWKLDLNHSLP